MTQEAIVLSTSGGVCRCVGALRRRRGLSQSELAAAVGRSQQWVSAFERGQADVSLGDVVTALSAVGATVVVRPVSGPQELVQAGA